MSKRYAVIMAGGRGERFWPRSRLQHPKHLLPIVGDKPMLAQTVERLDGFIPRENIFVITNREQHDAVVSVCSMLPPENVVSEPMGRDTAAAVGLATVVIKHRDPQASLAMLPADHVIQDSKGFQSVLDTAFQAAEKEPVLVTIGITPTEPATGYGYIHRGDELFDINGRTIYRVQRFVEKPNLQTAKQYLDSGEYFWNAGMFVWTAETIAAALEDHTPSLYRGLTELESGLRAGRSLEELLDEVYPTLDRISIDYAVMEKAGNVVTVESDFDWDDVGSWPAVARHFKGDDHGNTLRGAALVDGGEGNIVISDKDHLLAVCGVDDLIVVHAGDATLVCPKDKAEKIKGLVKKLGDDPRWKSLL